MYILVLVEVEGAGHSGQASQQGSQHGAHAAVVHHHAAAAKVLAVIYKAMDKPELTTVRALPLFRACPLQGRPLPCRPRVRPSARLPLLTRAATQLSAAPTTLAACLSS